MDRSGLQRILPIIFVVIIVVVAVAALVSLGRMLFGGGDASPSPTPTVNTGKEALRSTLADRSVRMTVRGPIVAPENFHSYVISISPDNRIMTTYVGYTGNQVDNSQLGNTMRSYEEFVFALDRANLMEATPLEGDANDIRGICATGRVYEFEVLQGTNIVRKLWTSTCRGSLGSLKANREQVTRLFELQIPDYSRLASKINLS